MQRQEIVVAASGEILQHSTDFDAVGMQFLDFVHAKMRSQVEDVWRAVQRDGKSRQCVCAIARGLDDEGESRAVVLVFSPLDAGSVSVLVREAVSVPENIALSLQYQNLLIEPGNPLATIENETPDKAEAVAWLDGWLDEPLGLVPAVVPPRG